MRRFLLPVILLFAAYLCSACVSTPRAQEPVRVLFVGNSLTYVGNLPAVLDALAETNKRPVQSDMIAKGGATLTEHLSDGSAERALAGKRYDFVVLQERGGDFICGLGPESCKDAEAALDQFNRLAEAHGAKAILLGTYQQLPAASLALEAAEAKAAKRLAIAHVPVSEYFRAGVASEPHAEWLNKDGVHPGHDLILLEAALLYRQLFGILPVSAGFTVHAPMQGPTTKTVSTHAYTAERSAVVLGIASGGSP